VNSVITSRNSSEKQTAPAPKSLVPVNNRALMEQRRALGQCFKCGDKYFPDHQCKVKIQMLLGQDGDGVLLKINVK
jgi:hypothetical protein